MDDDEFEDMLVLVNKERKTYTSEQLQKEAEMIERFSEDYDADLVKIAFYPLQVFSPQPPAVRNPPAPAQLPI